jgi:hypothetical protein
LIELTSKKNKFIEIRDMLNISTTYEILFSNLISENLVTNGYPIIFDNVKKNQDRITNLMTRVASANFSLKIKVMIFSV